MNGTITRILAAALTVLVSAVLFAACFTLSYSLGVEHVHLYYLRMCEFSNTDSVRRVDIDFSATPTLHPRAQWRGQMEARTFSRLSSYGTGGDYLWQWQHARAATAGQLYGGTPVVALATAGAVGLLVAAAWWRKIAAMNMDSERLRFAAGVIRASAARLHLLAAIAGLGGGASLITFRFLSIIFASDFDDGSGTSVRYSGDTRGVAVAALVAVVLFFLTYRAFIFAQASQRVLGRMGRCRLCGYPSTTGRPCSECGAS